MADGCLVGVDGGGTKTIAKVVSPSTGAVMCFTGESANICGAGKEAVETGFRALFHQVRAFAGEQGVAAVCMGVAGMSNPQTKPFFARLLSQLAPGARLMITSDAEIALCGALMQTSGTILIAGTGSVCLGRLEDGTTVKSGGFGHLLDDEGSAYALGRDALRAAVRAYDRRGPDTLLAPMLAAQYGLDNVEKIIYYVYEKQKKEMIAAIAPLVSRACEAGDGVALEIVSRAAGELASLAGAVLGHGQLAQGKMALMGGAIGGCGALKRGCVGLLQSAYPRLTLVEPAGSAVDGALLLLTS